MRPTLRLIQNGFLLLPLILSACALVQPAPREGRVKISPQKVFPYAFDKVWRAAQLTLNYPIKEENIEQGIMRTEDIRATDGFVSPDTNSASSPSAKYNLTLHFAKGFMAGRPSTMVNIEKKLVATKDFFSDDSNIDTDGLEELALFYRIEREVTIQDALARAQKSNP